MIKTENLGKKYIFASFNSVEIYGEVLLVLIIYFIYFNLSAIKTNVIFQDCKAAVNAINCLEN